VITEPIGGSSALLARIHSGVSGFISADQQSRWQLITILAGWRMLGPLPARTTAVSQFHITTQDDLPGPDGDEPYTLFVNQTEYGNARFLRTNVLSARPDLKKYTALRFRQEVKHHADAVAPGEDVVVVFMEAQGLEPPLTLVCSDLHLEMEGYPVEQGAEIEIPLLPPGSRGAARGFG
jgi:hypothetical protein